MEKWSLRLDKRIPFARHLVSLIKVSSILAVVASLISSTVLAQDRYAGFPEPQSDFKAHIAQVHDYLSKTQMRQRTEADIQYNLPFELPADEKMPYRGKFMLFHGLNDSPYVWSDIAPELSSRGFDVRAILLPGHGNSPEAQLDMSYTRWIKAAREHLNFWIDDDNTPVYLGGFSLGGVLATAMAIERGDVDGMLLFSPAYKSSMNHLLRWSSIYSVFKPWIFGGMIIEDNPTKYNSIPVNGATQYYKTTKYLKRIWGSTRLSMPVLMVASTDDSVVDVDHMAGVFNRRFTSENRQLLIYSNDEDVRSGDFIMIRPSAYPALRVLNQSHQSVLMSEANPLFGKNGSVLVCNGNDWETFSGCLYSEEQHWYGAQHTPSPDGLPVARVTYNPDFNTVLELFDKVFSIR